MYYEKYLKYKEKYLSLKNRLKISQTGGDMVRDVSLLKNINFFKCPRSYQPYTKDMIENSYKSKEDYLDDRSYLTLQDVYNLLSDHLCLVHGFIWNNTGLIKNYYKF
jgi:hypothetical protein